MRIPGLDDEPDAVERTWHPSPWWAWMLGLSLLGTVALVGAGTLLADADFGTSLRARGCDPSALPGLGLLAFATLSLGLGLQVARLRWPESFVVWDAESLLLSLPIPLGLLAATLPAVLGCAAGSDIAKLPLVGSALAGNPGIALAACAAALVGTGVAASMHVGWVAPLSGSDAAPGIVELAMQEAEALEQQGATSRFHNVESGD